MKLFQESPDIKSNSMRRAREFTGWGYVHIGPTVGALLTAFWALAMDYDVHILLHATASPTTTELRCTQSRPRPRLVRRSLVRYCQNSVRTPTFFGHNFKETVRLRLIQADISKALFGKSDDTDSLLYEQALIFKARLGAWYHALPEPLSASKIVYPGHISLQ